ncbi:YihY/virulence factor BrkB family protein [Sinimarinibacterium sp. CAU 1509]|uniref:YihY/virulence factor BrkB family protein n=1 Tax=Sinimarinibacterium sp. CAU 1509 TaxID=2562283 RepID=UPI0010AD2EDA|nr:YihY/virulence factor BrkB family protein [Sinimarinibacterium sp. CAU 1509]TJY65080.1 YihY/virulence factor BrkB family protein [Sinimarinibacterium sp. CAU 1509]
MGDLLQRIREHLWDSAAITRYPQRLIAVARYLFVLLRDLLEGQLSMRAMSLVYTTLLSIVPLLALSFSVLKALGAHNSLEPVLLEFLRPLGPQAETLTANIIGFVENIRVGLLGSVGVALLMWAAISLIQKVEAAFNYIWRIERPRPLSQRLGEYFAVLTVGPVAIFLALGATASVLNSEIMSRIAAVEPLGLLIYMGTRLLPYVLIVGAFTFLYGFMPNTRVRWSAAAAGGLVAGLLWQSGSAAFASFVSSATNYNAIYSGFAILIFLLIWLHVGWLILLIGCQLAFYVQHPEHLKPQRTPALLSPRETEFLALTIMSLVGTRFIRGESGLTQEQLSLKLDAEPEHVARVVDVLVYHGLLAEAGHDRTQLIPGIDLDSIELSRLWRLVRAGLGGRPGLRLPAASQVSELLDQSELAFEAQTGSMSLRRWLTQANSKP